MGSVIDRKLRATHGRDALARPAHSLGSRTLRADDARWILAARTRERLQGGRAAILTAESRTRLIEVGRRLGLRPFDVALIIAIVQDNARQPRSAEDPGSLIARLRMVPGPGEAPSHAGVPEFAGPCWLAWIAGTLVLAALLGAAGAAWLAS